jgi:NTP pyrophosphatase (non-canonical NTP hydrolase)
MSNDNIDPADPDERAFVEQWRETLNLMAGLVEQCNRDNGWYDESVSVGDLCALLHSEVSEAFDAWRKHGFEDQTGLAVPHHDFDPYTRETVAPLGVFCKKCGNVESNVHHRLPKPEGYGSELADVLIRLLDQASRHGVDLAGEFARKLAYNRTRSYRHGGRRV